FFERSGNLHDHPADDHVNTRYAKNITTLEFAEKAHIKNLKN
ncbi:MAG: hypothetical protein ACI8RN_000991, partial [Glaciecola sp.]